MWKRLSANRGSAEVASTGAFERWQPPRSNHPFEDGPHAARRKANPDPGYRDLGAARQAKARVRQVRERLGAEAQVRCRYLHLGTCYSLGGYLWGRARQRGPVGRLSTATLQTGCLDIDILLPLTIA